MITLMLAGSHDETDRIRVLQFEAADGATLPSYTAGAHLDFDLGHIGSRSYSLVDWQPQAAQPTTYNIAVQREEDGDGGSKAMHKLQVGQTIKASVPSNDFELMEPDAPTVLLAGGIGVTPLISMATALKTQQRPFSFHYSARSAALMGFYDSIHKHLGDKAHFYFDDVAPLNLSVLMENQSPDSQLYLCGPKGMIEAARIAATSAGVSEQNIHVELFSTPATSDGDVPFEVEIKDTGEVFNIPVGKTIIDVLEGAGKDLMFDCQRGDCGICQTDVISGVPDHRDVVLSESDRASGKVMQICVSRAKSERLVLDL